MAHIQWYFGKMIVFSAPMIIESADYYSIILDPSYRGVGAEFINEIKGELCMRNDHHANEDIAQYCDGDYCEDIRCLIGFALMNSDYAFGVGGLCHVIGHRARPAVEAVRRSAEKIQHSSYGKIEALMNAMNHSS